MGLMSLSGPTPFRISTFLLLGLLAAQPFSPSASNAASKLTVKELDRDFVPKDPYAQEAVLTEAMFNLQPDNSAEYMTDEQIKETKAGIELTFIESLKEETEESIWADIPEWFMNPPFKGVAWMKALEKVFDKGCKEYDEMVAKDPERASPYGRYVEPLQEPEYKDPAYELNTNIATESENTALKLGEYGAFYRLEDFFREKGETNPTMWTKEPGEAADNETDTESDSIEAGPDGEVPEAWANGNLRDMEDLEANERAFYLFGNESWGYPMRVKNSMNANTDPWLNFDKDAYDLEWDDDSYVQKTLEHKIEKKLELLQELFDGESRARREGDEDYLGGVKDSLAPEADKIFYNFVVRPGTSSSVERKRTCAFANNKWVENEEELPEPDWNPGYHTHVWNRGRIGVTPLSSYLEADKIQVDREDENLAGFVDASDWNIPGKSEEELAKEREEGLGGSSADEEAANDNYFFIAAPRPLSPSAPWLLNPLAPQPLNPLGAKHPRPLAVCMGLRRPTPVGIRVSKLSLG